MCELLTWPWPRYLLSLSLALRIVICATFFSFCLVFYIFAHNVFECSALLSLPMALSAWNFKEYGACSCFFSALTTLAIYHILSYRTLLLPISVILSGVSIAIVMFLTGAALVSLRKLLDSEEQARARAEESEHQNQIASEKFRQLVQIKNQFVQNVNHELRTPLMAAYGYFEYLQLLLEEHNVDDLRSVDRSEPIRNALRSCEELCVLVNNVLTTMEIGNDSRPLPLQRVSVLAVVREIFNSVDMFSRKKQRTQLVLPPHLTVWAQEQCLRHVLYNLLSNAFKYSPPDAPVIISASPYGEQGRQICIRVQDRGPGIPPEECPTIFERFTRLQRDIGSPIRGTGVGLYICKHLVEAMHGEIWVESTGIAGQGSCFCFTLPRTMRIP
jgi:signal transduction histidine kinase